MRRKLVTIRDVAELAGVSVSTVSHVLNGNDQHVGPAKREIVLEAVNTLRYRPNAIARSMVRQKTATVGLVLPELDNPLFMPVVAGVEEVLRPAGYHIVLVSAPDVESEMQAIETLRSQQVDGFIFMSLSTLMSNEHLIHLKNEGIPLVVINRRIDDEAINSISWADHEVGYAATRHLISLGHRHIGTICGPIEHVPMRRSAIERHEGWQQALLEADLPVRPEWVVDGKYTYKGGYEAIQQLVSLGEQGRQLPSALFVASDMMAIGVLKALHQAELYVPEQMAIVTTGDPPLLSYTIPALTTLSQPILEAGHVAARIMLEQFTDDGTAYNAQHITLSSTLQIRESCGAWNRSEGSSAPVSI